VVSDPTGKIGERQECIEFGMSVVREIKLKECQHSELPSDSSTFDCLNWRWFGSVLLLKKYEHSVVYL
jgi:hypothetical protein